MEDISDERSTPLQNHFHKVKKKKTANGLFDKLRNLKAETKY